MKKVTLMVLVGAVCLLGVVPALADWSTIQNYEKESGKKIAKFSEAPMLQTMVAAGELPSVEERLPEEPRVIEPVEEVGQYGGIRRSVYQGGLAARAEGILGNQINEPLITLSRFDHATPIPNIAKGWQWNEDTTEITFFLRKGMKWSDGQAFTADDFLFWWEDIQLNDELTPVKPAQFRIDGELGLLEKVDDYAIKWTFAKPFGYFIDLLSRWWYVNWTYHAPKHYMKQFHPDYTPMEEIEQAMKEEGFGTWMDLFRSKLEFSQNPDIPVINPWIVQSGQDVAKQVLKRNPYYWKVDTEGNQLPYIDSWERTAVPNPEAILLKVLAGEVDFVYADHGVLTVADYPLIMERREEADYRLLGAVWPSDNVGTVYLNYSHQDPVLRELFLEKDFRIALSVAINRKEINKLVFKGTYFPSQVSYGAPGPPFYGDKSPFTDYIDYNAELANQLLDGIGLTKRDAKGYRLRPDGKELLLVNTFPVGPGSPAELAEVTEMYKQYWSDVGVRVVAKPVQVTLWEEQLNAGEHDITTRQFGGGGSTRSPLTGYVFPSGRFSTDRLWALWTRTGGEAGREPIALVKRLAEIESEIMVEPEAKKRTALFYEAITIHAENLLEIGGLTKSTITYKVIVNNRLRNVSDPVDFLIFCVQPSSWFIREE